MQLVSLSEALTRSRGADHEPHSRKTRPQQGLARAAVLHGGCTRPGRGHLHAAVGEGQAVRVAGQALLLTVIGAGGRGEGVAGVDVVGIDRLPPGSIPANKQSASAAAPKCPLTLSHVFRIIWYPHLRTTNASNSGNSRKGWHLPPESPPPTPPLALPTGVR